MLGTTLGILIVSSLYSGSGLILIAILLALAGASLIFLGIRMRKEIKLPEMNKVLGAIVIVIWAFSILAFLKLARDYSKATDAVGGLGPIFPVTLVTAFCSFGYVAYISRRGETRSALWNGFLAFIAGPMVFEIPYVLLKIPTVRAPMIPEILYLTALFTVIFTSLAMLLLSRSVALKKNSVYLSAGMIFVFALWVLEGFSYPSHPVPFTLNVIAKVLGFAAVIGLFITPKQQRMLASPQELLKENVIAAVIIVIIGILSVSFFVAPVQSDSMCTVSSGCYIHYERSPSCDVFPHSTVFGTLSLDKTIIAGCVPPPIPTPVVQNVTAPPTLIENVTT
jgi:hypothetical protein